MCSAPSRSDDDDTSSDGDSLSVATSVASSVDSSRKHQQLTKRLRLRVAALKRTLAEERDAGRLQQSQTRGTVALAAVTVVSVRTPFALLHAREADLRSSLFRRGCLSSGLHAFPTHKHTCSSLLIALPGQHTRTLTQTPQKLFTTTHRDEVVLDLFRKPVDFPRCAALHRAGFRGDCRAASGC